MLMLIALCAAANDATLEPPTPPQPALALWYAQPAAEWLEALPLGNGRIGAMAFGGVAREKLALNDATFWSGCPSRTPDAPAIGKERLAEIRKLFFDGKWLEAREAAKDMLGTVPGGDFGTNLPVNDLVIEMSHGDGSVTGYRRELDLDTAIARVLYTIDGVTYTREAWISHPDQVLAVRLTADKPGVVSFSASLTQPYESFQVAPRGANGLTLTGDAKFAKTWARGFGVGIRQELTARAAGGVVTSQDDRITVNGADEVLLLLTMNTDFKGADPMVLCGEQMRAAESFDTTALRDRHMKDHQELFRRVSLRLGEPVDKPTGERWLALKAGAVDTNFEALYFQYGRYLMIAGSRHDSPLPMHLQGIWNDGIACEMGWTCDYHLDINEQQIYWPADVCALDECLAPLFRLTQGLAAAGRETAQRLYGSPGWVAHTVTNPWGYTAPGNGLGWGLHPTGGLWIALHMWDHYTFTRDRNFLANTAYPVLRESAEFFLDYMVEHPRLGWLVTGPSVSPENSFWVPGMEGKEAMAESMGPTCDAVFARELFNAVLEGAETLDLDAPLRDRLHAALAKLPPLRAGKNGQLMEWLEDYEEAVPQHRHTTHLVALYPYAQITPRKTPDLARAARVSLERRMAGDNWESVEWTYGNFINFFARLGDGDAARVHLDALMFDGSAANLLSYSRAGIAGSTQSVASLDGNFAASAGIAEMLLQSHEETPEGNIILDLLPALPAAWREGEVRGLRGRGGFAVDITWREGRLSRVCITSLDCAPCAARYGEAARILPLGKGEVVELDGALGEIPG